MTPYELTAENVERFMTALQGIIHTSHWKWYTPKMVMQILAAKTTVVVALDNDSGVAVFERTRPEFDASLSFVVWDGRLEEHFWDMVEAVRSVGNLLQLEQLRAFVPEENRAMANKLAAMGFHRERLSDVQPNGKLVWIFGIHYDELIDAPEAEGEEAYGRLVADTAGPAMAVPGHQSDVHDFAVDESAGGYDDEYATVRGLVEEPNVAEPVQAAVRGFFTATGSGTAAVGVSESEDSR